MSLLLRLLLICFISLHVELLSSSPLLPSASTIPNGFGVNVHFDSSELSNQISLLKRAGFSWIRMGLYWEIVEKKQNVYDFSDLDNKVRAFRTAGLKMVVILAFTNANYCRDASSPISPYSRAAFARFAGAAAARYAGLGIVWEIYNEPNAQFWRPVPDATQYVELADEATIAIESADRTAIVVGPALAGPELVQRTWDALVPRDSTFLSSVLASKAAHMWSALTIHPYQGYILAPEHSRNQLNITKNLVSRYLFSGSRLPVIFGEWGYSTFTAGVSEILQAAYASRCLLLGTMNSMPFSIWYDWQDDGNDPADPQDRFGLIRYGSVAGGKEADLLKPAFHSVSEMATLLAGFSFDKVVQEDHGVEVVHFVKRGAQAFVLWSAENTTTSFDINLPHGDWHATRLLGSTHDIHVSSATRSSTFLLDAMPLLVISSPPK